MKNLKWLGLRMIVAWLLCLAPVLAQAQLTPPDWPTNISSWGFYDTNTWTSDLGYLPLSSTNIGQSSLGDNGSLSVDTNVPAWLQYNVFEKDGWTNLTVDQGTITFWFAPGSWASTNGGTGPGDWGRLIEAGAYTTNASYGWWSLFLDPGASNVYFSAQTNSGDGATTTFLSAPVGWNTNEWHFLGLTYSASNSALYLDGVLVTNGLPVTVHPGLDVLTNGFYIGSDSWSVTRHLLTTTLPVTPQGTPVTRNTYDARDWLANVENPLGKFTYYTNDAAQRLIATTDPLSRTTMFGYDDDGHRTTITDAALNQTAQTWDARGNLIRILDAATNIVGKVCDGSGNLIYLTNRNGHVWQFQHDGANRLTNTISPLNRSFSVVYDNRGLLQSSTDPMTNTTTFGYDARRRITSKSDNVGVNHYTYDGNGNLVLLTNMGTGVKLSWGFDAYNRLASFTNSAGYVIQYRHDANGNLTNLIYPGNRIVTYFYDGNNRLTNMMDWAGRQTAYTYDLAGRLTGVLRPNNTLRSMNFDDDGELTNIVEQTTAKFPITFYKLHYDSAGRIDWEFKGPLPHSFIPSTRTMTYDADNRLATFNSANVTLDANGNLTYGPLTNNTLGTYIYDARNELTSAEGVSYGYDPAGNLTSLTNGSTITTFVVNPQGSQVLMRINGGTTNYYVYGASGLAYEVDETATLTSTGFYHFDRRGSTVAITDSNGNPTDGFEYSAYGTLTYRFGTNDTPFCYNGQFGVQTAPNGLLYMRARCYNPYLSRFLNPDPSGLDGGLNFYAFADGNPISNEDPFGLQVPGPVEVITGFGPGYGESVADYNARVQATADQALPIEVAALGGYTVGAAGSVAVAAGATGLVAIGVPQSVVTGGLLVTGSAGIVASGYSIYNNPSPENIAFNAGGLGGAFTMGGFQGGRVSSALSSSGYQPSGPATFSSDISMAWRGANGNINPFAFLSDWILPGAQVGPMSTGPSTIGAATTIGGAGAGITSGTSFLLWNPSGK